MDEVSDEGRIWAAISYVGMFAYLPLGAVPLLMRNDAFALQHAKYATAAWLGWFVSSVVLTAVLVPLSFCTLGLASLLAIPLIALVALWPLVTGVHGLILVMNSDWSEPMGGFGLHDKLFSSVKLQDREKM